MKINKIEFLFKIFFLIIIIGSSDCFKTRFGLLKKSNKKSNSNNSSSKNLYKSNKQNTQKDTAQTQQQQTNAQTLNVADSTLIGNESTVIDGNANVATLPDQPVYAQGWIKYLHYDDAGKQKPKKFWKNTLFEQEQRIKDDNTKPSSDEVNFFYFI